MTKKSPANKIENRGRLRIADDSSKTAVLIPDDSDAYLDRNTHCTGAGDADGTEINPIAVNALADDCAPTVETETPAPLPDAEPIEQKPHHPASAFFPLLEGLEYDELKKDIDNNGLVEPILLYDGQILDGRNRERACRELKIEPRFQNYTGTVSAEDLAISLNLTRRHLDESQRALAAVKAMPILAANAKERQRAAGRECGRGKDSANLRQAKKGRDSGKASEDAARRFNVSPRSVESAMTVEKHGIPELLTAVENRTVSISTAAEITKLPKEKQRELIDLRHRKLIVKELKALRSSARRPVKTGRAKTIMSPHMLASSFGEEVSQLCRIRNRIESYVNESPRGGSNEAIKTALSALADEARTLIQILEGLNRAESDSPHEQPWQASSI